MKQLVLLCTLLSSAYLNSHCPCNASNASKETSSKKTPCGSCAQASPTKASAPPKLLNSPQAHAHLARIKANEAALQKIIAERIAKIEQQAKPPLEIIKPYHVTVAASQPVVPITSAPAAQPAPTPSTPSAPPTASPQAVPATTFVTPLDDEKTELEWPLLKTIAAALTPLITAYPTEKLIPQDPTKRSLDEQLEQMHTIATFITKLKIKLEILSPEARIFIKTASFAGHPVARMIARNLLSLQSLFASQLEAYKQVKPQSTLVKELKKLTTSCAKEVDGLCKELLNV